MRLLAISLFIITTLSLAQHARTVSPVAGEKRIIHEDGGSEAKAASEWPHGPFRTEGRNIVNSHGDIITWAGVNWPMSGETMIPEGLEWASADQILDDVASVGWNFIRMYDWPAPLMLSPPLPRRIPVC
jgi:hypothetical protein